MPNALPPASKRAVIDLSPTAANLPRNGHVMKLRVSESRPAAHLFFSGDMVKRARRERWDALRVRVDCNVTTVDVLIY